MNYMYGTRIDCVSPTSNAIMHNHHTHPIQERQSIKKTCENGRTGKPLGLLVFATWNFKLPTSYQYPPTSSFNFDISEPKVGNYDKSQFKVTNLWWMFGRHKNIAIRNQQCKFSDLTDHWRHNLSSWWISLKTVDYCVVKDPLTLRMT